MSYILSIFSIIKIKIKPERWIKYGILGLGLVLSIILFHCQQSAFSLTTFTFATKFIDYLMGICADRDTPIEVIQLTLSIASRYMQNNSNFCEPTQLILLVSLFLAGKVISNSDGSWGCFTVNDLHKYSNHCFTNKDFYRLQKKILEQIKFDVLAEGICDRQIKLILLMLKQILDTAHIHSLNKVTEDIQYVLWHYLFSKSDKQKLFKKIEEKEQARTNLKMQKLITGSIIQSALILCTQCVGRFPATVWLLHTLDLKEDELSLWTEDVLKIVLGKQKFEQLKL